MTVGSAEKDLIILVPDRKMEFALNGLLLRTRSLGIRDISFDIHRHPQHDPGCFLEGPQFLEFATGQAGYALVVLDFEGSGVEHKMSATEMEKDLETRLDAQGWASRSAAVVIAPELEIWAWSDSPRVDEVLGWSGRSPALRDWLSAQGFVQHGDLKPPRPKEAFIEALRATRKPLSSSLYFGIANKVSLERCTDRAFLKLRHVLYQWFKK